MTAALRVPRAVALWAIAALVAASSLVSFGESYRGLYLWAHGHGLAGLWAAVFPLMVDCFIAVGELALFVAMIGQWERVIYWWGVTGLGLVVSVLGNVGHVTSDLISYRVTAAVPPLAAAASLTVGLGVLKRIRAGQILSRDEESACALVQSARVAYCDGDYDAALGYIQRAEMAHPPIAPELAKARTAVLAAANGPAITEGARD